MNKPVIAVGVVLLAVVVAAVVWKERSNAPAMSDPQPVACTMEAMVCPDGSSVGRVGPNCDFAACPVAPTPMPEVTEPQGTDSIPLGWKGAADISQNIAFGYPEKVNTTYLAPVDWPPRIVLQRNTPFVCTPSGSEQGAAGKTERLPLNGRIYCLTRQTEGAAGSTFTKYDYTFAKDQDLGTLSFTLRAPQCENYAEPKRTECETERVRFSPDQLADQMIRTLRVQ